MSRNEKKVRKSLGKVGLKHVAGVDKIVFKKSHQVVFALENPDLYKSAGDTYIVFGDVKMDDFGSGAAQTLKDMVAEETKKNEADSGVNTEDKSKNRIKDDNKRVEDEEPVDAQDLSEKDIEMVMAQTNVSRNTAIRALLNNNKDIVDTIMVYV